MLIFYGLHVLGLVWTEDLAAGIFALEEKAALLLIPLVFNTLPNRRDDGVAGMWQAGALVIFVWRILAAAAGWGDAGWRYADFTGPFHPTYLAIYWAVAVLFVRSDWRRWLLPIFAVAIGLAASKAGWIGGAFALLWVWGAAGWKRMALPVGLALVALVMASGIADQGRSDEFVRNSTAEVVGEPTDLKESKGSTGGRRQAWSVSWDYILSNPIFGVGTGDVEATLVPAYESRGLVYAANHRMNPHNAYLQAALSLGLLGLLSLLLWWGLAAWRAWKDQIWSHLGILLLIAMNGLFESILELQQGIVPIVLLTFMAGVRHNRSLD
jgi:O-antigen ligase